MSSVFSEGGLPSLYEVECVRCVCLCICECVCVSVYQCAFVFFLMTEASINCLEDWMGLSCQLAV